MVYGNRQKTKSGWLNRKIFPPQENIRALNVCQTCSTDISPAAKVPINDENVANSTQPVQNLTQLLLLETMRHNMYR